jgi:hypothetical protein
MEKPYTWKEKSMKKSVLDALLSPSNLLSQPTNYQCSAEYGKDLFEYRIE